MTRTLAILGAGGHGRVVADSAEGAGWSVTLFDGAMQGDVDGWSIGGTAADLDRVASSFDGVVVGIGNNAARLTWLRRLEASGGTLVTVIDPGNRVSTRSSIAPGSFLAPGTVANTGAQIGLGSSTPGQLLTTTACWQRACTSPWGEPVRQRDGRRCQLARHGHRGAQQAGGTWLPEWVA